jgi:site-specific DNA recombinase
MRVVAYIRVSTEGQAVEGVSLDAQRARIAAWAAANDGTLCEGDVHVDAGISGKRWDNRPGLKAALDSVCGGGGVLVVYSLSRLARSTRDTINIAERLERAGADLVSLSEKIDTTSASGKMLFRLMAVLNEFERDLIAERTRTALAHKRDKSELIGHVPYGSNLDPDGRTLVACPAELAVMADVWRMRAEGRSLRKIAAELTGRGVPTKGGRPWSHSSIVSILERKPSHAPDREEANPPPSI